MSSKIIVGLSGGVDSAVTAKLLLDQGFEVEGVFMRNWNEGDALCEASREAPIAESVAKFLGIPFRVVDFSEHYWEKVFSFFLAEHAKGRTPSPDILCNEFIKFSVFWDFAASLGAKKIATGHYAKIGRDTEQQKFTLEIPTDTVKDQTYFLHRLNQKQLEVSLFPLAEMTKSEVRNFAKKQNFPNAEKKDSTGICFIGERKYADFLGQFLVKTPGNFRDTETRKVVGTHQGVSFYTIGQGKNLGIGGIKGAQEAKWFVVEKNFAKNEIGVSQDPSALLKKEIRVEDLRWISGTAPGKSFEASVRIRHRETPKPAQVTLESEGSGAHIWFQDPVRAIAPGQYAVIYQGERCLGGGVIC